MVFTTCDSAKLDSLGCLGHLGLKTFRREVKVAEKGIMPVNALFWWVNN